MTRIRWEYDADRDRFTSKIGGVSVFETCCIDHGRKWWDVSDATRSVVVRHLNRNAAARAVVAAEAVLP